MEWSKFKYQEFQFRKIRNSQISNSLKWFYLNMDHSCIQLVWLYQVYSNWYLYNELIFLNYLHSLQVIIHSILLLFLILRVHTWVLMTIQMFLSSMESILMVKMLSIDYIRIIFNMMKVWYLFYSSLESIELFNIILPHIKQIENDDNPLVIENEDDFDKLNDKNWSSIIVKKELFEEMEDELIMNDYPHVQFIHIQKRSFMNISSLTISNLPELKYLAFELESFYKTTSLTLSSIL